MPVTVACPGCSSKLKAPDTAAGKKVKCPKCAVMLTVPDAAEDFEVVDDDFEVVDDDFEVVDDVPAKAKPKKASKRDRIDDEDEDDRPRRRRALDEDDEDDRPRKKKGKKKFAAKKQSSMMPLIAGVIALVVVGCIAGFFLFGKGKKNGSASSTGETESWVKFDAPDGSYSAMFPSAPSATDVLSLAQAMGEDTSEMKSGVDVLKSMGITIEVFQSADGNRKYISTTLKFPGPIPNPGQFEQQIRQQSRTEAEKSGTTFLGDETTTLAGSTVNVVRAKSKTGKYQISATVIKGDRAISLAVVDDVELSISDEKVRKFFESLVVNVQSPGTPANPTTPAPPRRRR